MFVYDFVWFSTWPYKQIHTNTCTHMSADHLQDLQWKRASRSMHSQVYGFGCFFGVVFGGVFFSFQDDFGAQHGPNLVRFWRHVGHFLDHFWVFFWHLNLRSLLRRFFIDFCLLFDSPHPQKHRPCRWFWGSLHLLRDRSWDRSWIDFGSILDPQIIVKCVWS